MSNDQPGVLADRYTLDRVIGRGGMADVYRATDHLLEREVAVKVLRAHTATERDRLRFEGEARTLAQFDHPNLVSVLDAGITTDDVPYLVMDLVEGSSLATLCADGPLPERQVARVGAALADALAYVHSHAVVHRDLKPGNVLIRSDGRVRLADFGIARLLGDTGQTATGTLIGTAAYLAPEQVRGDPITPTSDVYSLGLLLLEALSGVRAYTGTPTEAALARLHTPPPMPDSLTAGWVALLQVMTDRDPGRRPSARQVARALRMLAEPGGSERYAAEPFAGPSYVDEPTGEHPEPAPTRSRSRRSWVVVAAVVLVATLVGTGLLTLGSGHPTAAATVGPPVPAGAPHALRGPLRDLHDVVGTTPTLTPTLRAVDAAVVHGSWQDASTRLDDLVRLTIQGGEVGTLTRARADDVQAAAARLAADLPGRGR